MAEESPMTTTKKAGASVLGFAWKATTGIAMSLGAAFAVAHTGGLAAPLSDGIVSNVTSLYAEAFTDVKSLVVG